MFSCCNREDVYDQVLNRVEELTNELTVGDPTDKVTSWDLLLTKHAFNKIT